MKTYDSSGNGSLSIDTSPTTAKNCASNAQYLYIGGLSTDAVLYCNFDGTGLQNFLGYYPDDIAVSADRLFYLKYDSSNIPTVSFFDLSNSNFLGEWKGSSNVGPGAIEYFTTGGVEMIIFSCAQSNVVEIWRREGDTLTTKLGEITGYDSQGFNQPYGVSISSDGYLAISDYLNSRVAIYKLDYTTQLTIEEIGIFSTSDISPKWVVISDTYDVYVTSPLQNILAKFAKQ